MITDTLPVWLKAGMVALVVEAVAIALVSAGVCAALLKGGRHREVVLSSLVCGVIATSLVMAVLLSAARPLRDRAAPVFFAVLLITELAVLLPVTGRSVWRSVVGALAVATLAHPYLLVFVLGGSFAFPFPGNPGPFVVLADCKRVRRDLDARLASQPGDLPPGALVVPESERARWCDPPCRLTVGTGPDRARHVTCNRHRAAPWSQLPVNEEPIHKPGPKRGKSEDIAGGGAGSTDGSW